jgi:hypothetical protein
MTDSAISELPIKGVAALGRSAANANRNRNAVAGRAGFCSIPSQLWANLVPLTLAVVVAARNCGQQPYGALAALPAAKAHEILKPLGTVAFWFRAHIVLGVIGPVLILLHTNFSLGSVNSNMALLEMLIVAASGVGGRYLYGKRVVIQHCGNRDERGRDGGEVQ